MTGKAVRLFCAAWCLAAVPMAAQEVAPFALPSSTTGAEAVLLNPAALADLEGLHGYLGLQRLYQRTDGGKYPWKFGEVALAVDAFYSFGVYSSNSGFDMSRNLLGAGLSVAY